MLVWTINPKVEIDTLKKTFRINLYIYIRIYLLGGGECWRGRYLFSDKTIFKHFFSQNTYDTCI